MRQSDSLLTRVLPIIVHLDLYRQIIFALFLQESLQSRSISPVFSLPI